MEHSMIRLLIAAVLCVLVSPTIAAAADLGGYEGGTSGRYLGTVRGLPFWGEAFPYGYRWSLVKACTRYVPVETSRGIRMQRMWVCRTPRRYSFR